MFMFTVTSCSQTCRITAILKTTTPQKYVNKWVRSELQAGSITVCSADE